MTESQYREAAKRARDTYNLLVALDADDETVQKAWAVVEYLVALTRKARNGETA